MNIEEIRKGAPLGATHYQISRSYGLRYLKKFDNTDRWGVFYKHLNSFSLTFVGGEIKPL